ncbi:Protein ROOT HAIR DEFECTIVE 3 [Carex littledalei]|uniref:Protein ROOT HAIR DEFECTIVE 3 n=1 Tax=Carex littledalei TaxID=544730 RepID=A0A833V3Z0_9POAL|nr:Protein ROOT HAIR DEFECTIVE 3 [Carex littledalei]
MESLLRTMTEPKGGGGDKAISGLNESDSARIESDQSPQWVAGPVQLIGGDGTFYDEAIDDVINSKERWDHGTPYAIISVLGSQSPGRSSLLNSLFGVKFKDDDDSRGRNQNMRGVWLSRCAKPPLLVMDIELSDAKEDGLSFEKQTVLFAWALSDLLVVNMSLQEINRDAGGNIPLLRALLEQRSIDKLDSGQTKMLVVIHGYDDKLPFAKLHEDVLTKLQKLWASIHSPSLILSEFFEVLVVGLPDSKSKPQDFEEKVLKMRRWLSKEDITGFRKDRILALGFSLSARGVWDAIRQKKQLGVFLFGHKMTVSDTICANIVSEILKPESNQDLLSLKEGGRGASKEFTEKLASLLEATLTRFDTETQLYDEDVRHKKRGELEKSICGLVESTCKDILAGLHIKAFNESKQEIANQLSKAEDPTSGIDDAVKDSITKFVESCEDLSSRYSDLFNEHRVALEIELNAISEIIASNIEEKRKREEAECAKNEAELKAQDAMTQVKRIKETASLEIEQYKREVTTARSEAQRSKEETKQIAKQSVEEIHRISRLAKQETEHVKKELEIVKEEQRKEREQAKEAAEVEARRRANHMRLDMVRAVVVVARVVVFRDPTVIVDILDFALWHGKRSKGETQTLGSDSGIKLI